MTRQRKISGWPFKAEMIRANKEGRKTESRRTRGLQKINEWPNRWYLCGFEFKPDGTQVHIFKDSHGSHAELLKLKCPYGQKGDILYAKETYRKYYLEDENGILNLDNEIIEYSADGGHEAIPLRDGDGFQIYNKDGSERYLPWKPGMFMPKDVARIWMEVVDSYPERIQDITNTGAIDEGVMVYDREWVYKHFPEYIKIYEFWEEKTKMYKAPEPVDPRQKYRKLWFLINGQETWDKNIWVWVVKYKILSTTGKPEGI